MVAPGGAAWRTLDRRARRRTVAQAAQDGRWLVLAPHPDDETLGPGALLAGLAAAGARPLVAFLTDGSGSHPDAPGWSPARVAAVRRVEAGAALRCLGVADAPLLLDWPDAAPWRAGDAAFDRGVTQLAAFCRRHRVRRIATTWAGEPHCDHEAAAELAAAVARRCRIPAFAYLVWGWTVPDLATTLRHARVVAVDTAATRPAARRALACHRTQRGGRIAGGTRFRLPGAMMRLIDRPRTLLLEMQDAP